MPFGHDPISRLQVMPRGDDDETLAEALDASMPVSVTLMRPGSTINRSDTINEKELFSCLPAVAAGMREE